MSHDFYRLAELFRNFSQPVAILDLETTGGDFYQDRITEIAFLYFDRGRITAVEQLVNPHRPISPFVEQLTGISNEMVAHAPDFATYLPKILPLLRGSILIAHNSRFDYTFLCHESRRAGIAFAAPTLCSVRLSRKLYPEHHKHNLDSIIERHRICLEHRHRAMSDVSALAQFLQTAAAERGTGAWMQHAVQLMQPKLLPAQLNANLRGQLEQLSDSYGVSVFYDARGQVCALYSHHRTFSELAEMFGRLPDNRRPNQPALFPHPLLQAADMDFQAASGPLHALSLKAQIMAQHGLQPSEDLTSRHSIHIQPDASGCLKARIRPLRNGFHTEPPHGLFHHPKAAKRALTDWANRCGLCPALLGILPDEPPQGAPCPVSLVRRCSRACETHDTALHNQSVQAALPLLPVCDWGNSPRVRISECDPFGGETHSFICDSGALQLPDGRWYLDTAVQAVLKEKFKTGRNSIEALN